MAVGRRCALQRVPGCFKGNARPSAECTDAGLFQGAVKLIACDNDRSDELYKAAFVQTRLHVYRGDAVPVSNVGLNKAPDQASNKDEKADQPSSSKGASYL